MQKNQEIYCNGCGRRMEARDGIPAFEGIHVKKSWGYFSQKDGTVWEFDLCEDCCDRLKKEFVIPVSESETAELL